MKVSIKVTEEQKKELFSMKRPGNDYSDVLQRLLNLWNLLATVEPLLHGSAEYWRVKGGVEQAVLTTLQPEVISKEEGD